MDLGISGRVAMVAAASKGLGRASALALAEAGCRVSICARGKVGLDAARAELEAAGAEAIAVVCDVARAADCEAWTAETERRLGPADILVTNTGGPPAARFLELTDEQWEAGVQSTLMNVVRLSRLVAPGMQRRGWGRIVHITSLVARQPIDDLTVSGTLRSGISALTRLMANQFGPDGVLVNAVLPGNTLTDRALHLARVRAATEGVPPEQVLEQTARRAPLGRMAQPREIGDVVAFLASERGSYITGVSLLVDGGVCRAPY
ncbi:MAG TPA: SDR family oxidoreductase [Chthonomonadales bacterium]|nr:SDR family oxidoreductase [Chthonomonadales bacterium]